MLERQPESCVMSEEKEIKPTIALGKLGNGKATLGSGKATTAAVRRHAFRNQF